MNKKYFTISIIKEARVDELLAKLPPSQSAKQHQIGEQTEDKQYRADDHEQQDVYFLISDAEDVCPSVKPLNRNIESPVDPGDAAVCHACSSQ